MMLDFEKEMQGFELMLVVERRAGERDDRLDPRKPGTGTSGDGRRRASARTKTIT
jgi:hypothetical protein